MKQYKVTMNKAQVNLVREWLFVETIDDPGGCGYSEDDAAAMRELYYQLDGLNVKEDK